MRPIAPFLIRASLGPHPLRAALGSVILASAQADQAAEWTENVRFFLTTWLAGLVFFGTLLA